MLDLKISGGTAGPTKCSVSDHMVLVLRSFNYSLEKHSSRTSNIPGAVLSGGQPSELHSD